MFKERFLKKLVNWYKQDKHLARPDFTVVERHCEVKQSHEWAHVCGTAAQKHLEKEHIILHHKQSILLHHQHVQHTVYSGQAKGWAGIELHITLPMCYLSIIKPQQNTCHPGGGAPRG